jgi:hypothetical protein
MSRATVAMLALVPLAAGCFIPLPDEFFGDPECPMVVSYPDEDGDGLGDPMQPYSGCDVPEGYVTEAEPVSGDTADTADTGGADSGVG